MLRQVRGVLGDGGIHPVVATVVGEVVRRQYGAEEAAEVLVVGLLVEDQVAAVVHVVQQLGWQALAEGREGVLEMMAMPRALLRSSIP